MSKPDKKFAKILESPTKDVERPNNNILAALWLTILKDNQILPAAWSKAMTAFLDDPRNGVPKEGKKRSSDRNNFNKELARSNITWNVLYKGIRILAYLLDIRQLRLEITLIKGNGSRTTHTVLTKVGHKPMPDTISNEEKIK